MRDAIGNHALLAELASAVVSEEADLNRPFKCYQCLEEIKDHGRIRNHVGQHILRAMRDVREPLKGKPVSQIDARRLVVPALI